MKYQNNFEMTADSKDLTGIERAGGAVPVEAYRAARHVVML